MSESALIGDLHVHSRCSDGSYSVEGAVAEAARRSLGSLAIVDHDTTAGVDFAVRAGRRRGVEVVAGVEISAFDRRRNRKVHLLGYCFDRTGGNIDALCVPLSRARHEMTLRQIDVLARAGYPVDVEAVVAAASDGLSDEERSIRPGILFKQHIMLALIERGHADTIYGTLYRKLFKGDGICAFEIEYVDVFDALAAIKADGGAAVLAHPGQQDTWDMVEPLVAEGLDGIELYHPDHGPDDHERAMQLALAHDLVMTGGSDDHGAFGSTHAMGDLRAPYGAIEALRERSLAARPEHAEDGSPAQTRDAGPVASPIRVRSKAWDWSKLNAPEWNIASETFLPVAQAWVADGSVDILDFGCGVGRHALWLARHGASVTAIDLSPAGIETLRQTAARLGLDDRVTPVVSDMVNAHLEPASFDHVVAYHAIYHTDTIGLMRAIRLVRRALRDGGEFFVTFLSKRSPAFGQPGDRRLDARTYIRGSGPETGIPHTFLDYEEIVELMADFRIVKAQQIEDISPDGSKRAWHYFVRAIAE